jgi:outer membrane protein OmpA-like peptidoglycan-associated protein
MKIGIGATLVMSGALALAVTAFSSVGLADEKDPALAAAMKRHFGEPKDPAAAAATASPEAMVAYFTSGPPPSDVTVASRRHVDLDVKFSFDSAQLERSGIEQLDVAGKALQAPQLKGHRFMLSGHTDDRGDAEYNLELSLRRAESARQYLIDEYGIDADRLDATGHGSAYPLSTEDNAQARTANRRVVLEMVQ